MTRLCVIILNWNGVSDTLNCLDSLKNQSLKNLKFFVVDNGSTDDSKSKLLELAGKDTSTEILFNDINVGFAGGANLGLKWAIENNFDFVALLNNDAIADKNWLEELLEPMKETDTGITTSAFLSIDGRKIDSSGDWYSEWGLPFPRNRNDSVGNLPESSFVFGATGGASMYRVAMIKEIGLFDKDFFAYYEDVDLSFRAQLYGWKVYFNSKAIAYHKRGATSSKIPGFTVYQTFKNLPLLLIKNVPTKLLFSVGIRFKLAYSLMLLNAIKKGQGTYALKGFLMGIILSVKKIPFRLKLQNKKTVSDEYIKTILWQDLPPDQKGLRKFRRIFLSK